MNSTKFNPQSPGPHSLPTVAPMSLARMDYSILQQCMHCGMCLPTCPTYVETKFERHSPRGRIALMRAIADQRLDLTTAFAEEMYYCLGCLACETACPAGVNYAKLFESARNDIEIHNKAGKGQRVFWRWLAVKTIFMHPRLLRLVGRLLWLYQVSGLQKLLRKIGFMQLLPKNLRELEPQTPTICKHFSDTLIRPEETPAGVARYRVGLLTGCVQDLAFSDVNRDTADVLLANGCTVITPRNQSCCGSLHAHNGELRLAADLARRLIDAFEPEKLDAIISNAGGCGSHLKHFSSLLENHPDYVERSKEWDRKAKDIHEWLVEIDFRRPKSIAERSQPSLPVPLAYHESCHLCHGQKIVSQPRLILAAIPTVELCDLPESNWCCGSAGIYNITQPVTAKWLQQRKIENINKTKSALVATSNPGCHLQLVNGLHDSNVQVTQPVSLLAAAYRLER
jgi:glycolate oxidase iron-sulfur subunit